MDDNRVSNHMRTEERRTKMLENRWIAIRDRQGRLLREAETERLVRRAREARSNDGSSPSQRAVHAAYEAPAKDGARLVAVAAGHAGEPHFPTTDCSKA
jgi:hypothetical protein